MQVPFWNIESFFSLELQYVTYVLRPISPSPWSMLFVSVWDSFLAQASVLLICQYVVTFSSGKGPDWFVKVDQSRISINFLEIDLFSIIYVRYCRNFHFLKYKKLSKSGFFLFCKLGKLLSEIYEKYMGIKLYFQKYKKAPLWESSEYYFPEIKVLLCEN